MVDTPLEAFEKRLINLEIIMSEQLKKIDNIEAAIEELRSSGR